MDANEYLRRMSEITNTRLATGPVDLVSILEDQKQFNERVLKDKGFPSFHDMDLSQRTRASKEYTLLMLSETAELLAQTDFKLHRARERSVCVGGIQEAVIDVLKYAMSLATVWGISPEELAREYWSKSRVCEFRLKQKIVLGDLENRKVCSLDLDGVLNDYPLCWFDYVGQRTGKQPSFPGELASRDAYNGVLSPEEIDNLKHDYEDLGYTLQAGKSDLADILIDYLRSEGYTIVIVTSRDFDKHTHLLSDTLEWLDKNSIHFDALMHDSEKDVKMAQSVPNTRFLIEDSPNYVRFVSRRFPVIMPIRDYNKKLMLDAFTSRTNIVPLASPLDVKAAVRDAEILFSRGKSWRP